MPRPMTAEEADDVMEQRRDHDRDPFVNGPVQWDLASRRTAVLILDGKQVGGGLPIADAITVVGWLNTGGLRDLTAPLAEQLDTRDQAVAERDDLIDDLRAGHAGEEMAG